MASDDTSVLPTAMAPRAGSGRTPLIVASVVAVGALVAAGFLFVKMNELEQQVASAESRASAAEGAVSRARAELKRAQAAVADKEAELAKLRETPLPVDVTFRAGRPGTGFIAQIDNHTGDAIIVDVAIERAWTNESTTVQIDIPARGMSEIGAGNGWAFASGDSLKISGGTYRPLTLRVP
jgi:Tfp pilus assembly protein PilX